MRQRETKRVLTPFTSRFSEKEIYDVMYKYYGNQANIVAYLDCAYTEFVAWLQAKEERKQELQKARESLVQKSEAVLTDLLNSTDQRIRLDTVKYILGHIGRKQGWADSPQIAIQQAIVADEKKLKIMNIFGIEENEQQQLSSC